MPLADVMERADQTALQKTVVAFRKTRVQDHGPHVLLRVIDGMVRTEMFVQPLIAEMGVGYDGC